MQYFSRVLYCSKMSKIRLFWEIFRVLRGKQTLTLHFGDFRIPNKLELNKFQKRRKVMRLKIHFSEIAAWLRPRGATAPTRRAAKICRPIERCRFCVFITYSRAQIVRPGYGKTRRCQETSQKQKIKTVHFAHLL